MNSAGSPSGLVSDRELIKAISGYGRELFFSNIIDYIAQYHPEVISPALKEYLPDGFDVAERENSRMDIVFFRMDAKNQRMPVLVVENKRGSIATQKQLGDYVRKIKNNQRRIANKNEECRFLLISPHFFDKEVADAADWRFMGYAELGGRLNMILNAYAQKNPGYKSTLEYLTLCAAIDYMPFLEEESSRIYNSVTEDTVCSDLHAAEDSTDNIKLRYCAVANILKRRLEAEDLVKKSRHSLNETPKYAESTFDSGISSPLVSMEVKQLMKVKDEYVNFIVQFQGDWLSIGLGMKGVPGTFSKKEKKAYRLKVWKENEFASIIGKITGFAESLKDYAGTGYMTSDYILPMYRLNVRNKTVREIVDIMCLYAKNSIFYNKSINKLSL